MLLCWANAANNNIDTLESIGECLFRCLEVAFADLDTSVLQGNDGRFLDGSGTDKGVEFLVKESVRYIFLSSFYFVPSHFLLSLLL